MKRPPEPLADKDFVTKRDELLAAVTLRRHQAKELPTLRYTCDYSAAGGRGACTLLEAWASSLGTVMFKPKCRHSANHNMQLGSLTQRPSGALPVSIAYCRPVEHPATAFLLEELVADIYGRTGKRDVLLTGFLYCRHRIADRRLSQLVEDVRLKRGVVRISADDPYAIT